MTMAVTDEELQQMRDAVSAAREELEEINTKRIADEQATENDRLAEELKKEYDRIQAAIVQARGLNAKATDKPVDAVGEKAVAPPVPPKLENSAPANANAEGK